MGIKNIVKGLTKKVKKTIGVGEDLDLDEDFKTDLKLEEVEESTDFKDDLGEAPAEEPLGLEPLTSAPKPESPHEEKLEPTALPSAAEPLLQEQPSQETETITSELQTIKNKLETLETHLETLESQGSYQKVESERYIQYLTIISEKLDHLEKEYSELERLLKK